MSDSAPMVDPIPLPYATPGDASPQKHAWTRGHIPVLDGLRGCALLAVMLYHFTAPELTRTATGLAARIQHGLGAGWCGVDLFFVLSGFLITGILLDAKGTSKTYFKSFYIRRVLRIFPLYYGIVALVAIGSMIPSVSHYFGFDKITASLGWMCLYVSNFVVSIRHDKNAFGPLNHFWSLAVEEHFYMVWPALVWLCSRRRLAISCCVFVVGAFLLRCGISFHNPKSYAPYMISYCRVDGLALGALLALIVRSKLDVEFVRQWAWRIFGICLAVVLVLGNFGSGGFSHYGRAMETVGFSMFALLFASGMALAISAPETSIVRQGLEWAPLRSIGRYSFAMYVLHMACLRPFLYPLHDQSSIDWLSRHLHSANLGLFMFAILASLATYLLALLSWNLYEQHFLRLKRLFPY